MKTIQVPDFTARTRRRARVICAPLERDGFANAFSTRLGGVSPMPEQALNLAGFNETRRKIFMRIAGAFSTL